MKFSILVSAILFIIIQSHAQVKSDRIPFRTNELGLALRVPANSATEQSGADLMLKHWFKSWQAYRLSIGINKEYGNEQSVFSNIQQKAIRISSTKESLYAYAGGGIEAHRLFYKRVYLFAAVDTRFMLGKGKIETKKYLYKDSSGTSVITLLSDSSQVSHSNNFKWELTGSIGAKMIFSRITFGIEVFNSSMSYVLLNSADQKYNYGLFDLDLGNRSNRVFVTYRF